MRSSQILNMLSQISDALEKQATEEHLKYFLSSSEESKKVHDDAEKAIHKAMEDSITLKECSFTNPNTGESIQAMEVSVDKEKLLSAKPIVDVATKLDKAQSKWAHKQAAVVSELKSSPRFLHNEMLSELKSSSWFENQQEKKIVAGLKQDVHEELVSLPRFKK